MKNLLLPLILLVAACSCGGAQKSPYEDSRGDRDAEYAQRLMSASVKFEELMSAQPMLPQINPEDPSEIIIEGAVAPSEELDTIEGSSSGSGVVVSQDLLKGTSRILTANHVCETAKVGSLIQKGIFTIKIVSDRQRIITIDEEVVDFHVLLQDKVNDICIVETYHIFPAVATLADEMPPRGAFVSIVGAPEGEWGDHLVAMSDGRYFGQTDVVVEEQNFAQYAYYGFSCVGGYSGSAVYYRGKLIGLMTSNSTTYDHSCFGPSLTTIKDALNKVK